MTVINNIAKPINLEDPTLLMGDSMQFQFARMQLGLCLENKKLAEDRMDAIKSIHANNKYITEMNGKLEEYIQQGKNVPPSKELLEFCQNNKIPIPNGIRAEAYTFSEKLLAALFKRFSHASAPIQFFAKIDALVRTWAAELIGPDGLQQWGEPYKEFAKNLNKGLTLILDTATVLPFFLLAKATGSDIKWSECFAKYEGPLYFETDDLKNLNKRMKDFKEDEGGQVQNLMLQAQNFIGQYNSFLQGASTAIAQGNQVQTAIVKGQ